MGKLPKLKNKIQNLLSDVNISDPVKVLEFGHGIDNSIHAECLLPPQTDPETTKTVKLTIAKEIARRGGNVSAEHGWGRKDMPFDKTKYEEHCQIKQQDDPANMMNPGVNPSGIILGKAPYYGNTPASKL